MGWTVWYSISGSGKNFSFFQTVSVAHLSVLLDGCRHSFVAVKRQERDANHSSVSSAEVENEWSWASVPPSIPSWHWQGRQPLPLPRPLLHPQRTVCGYRTPRTGGSPSPFHTAAVAECKSQNGKQEALLFSDTCCVLEQITVNTLWDVNLWNLSGRQIRRSGSREYWPTEAWRVSGFRLRKTDLAKFTD